MPKKQASSNGNGKLTISYGAVGVLATVLTIGGGIWTIGSKIATKADVDSIKSTITPVLNQHESRIRDLELTMARYFGASQTGFHSMTPSDAKVTGEREHYVLAQYRVPDYGQSASANSYPQQAMPTRRVVVPSIVIQKFEMQPARGGSYTVLGEDGKSYSIDDVLAVILQLAFPERPQARVK